MKTQRDDKMHGQDKTRQARFRVKTRFPRQDKTRIEETRRKTRKEDESRLAEAQAVKDSAKRESLPLGKA